ncbi:MAG: hypothetical protein V4517_05665 [Pseudomonadota bacterium]
MRFRTKIILAVIGVALVWPFAQIGLIAAQAQYYANGRPYCIEVSRDHFRYRPVASLLELNGFTLEAPDSPPGGSRGSVQYTFHALLAIDAGGAMEWRNWSYWHQHFDRLTPRQVEVHRIYGVECLPQVDFILKLPLLAN